MTLYLQILGTSPKWNVPPSILLFSESFRVLFNTGDASKRLWEEHTIRLGKLTHLFVSSLDWNCCLGGLVDLVYELALNRKDISVCGPEGLIDICLAMRYFLYRPGFSLSLNDILTEDYKVAIGEDRERLEIEPLFVTSSKHQKKSTYKEEMINPLFLDGLSFEKEFCQTKKHAETIQKYLSYLERPLKFIESPSPEKNFRNFCITLEFERPVKFLKPTPNYTSISYIIHTPLIPPKFDPKKANELGVPTGPLFGKLVKGETVTTADGRTVRPEDCMIGELLPGSIAIIVYCPSEDYTASLYSHPKWEIYYSPRVPRVACIVHITPADILLSEPYVIWMKKFPKDTKHMFVNSEMCSQEPVLIRSESFIKGLNCINNQIFSLPHRSSGPSIQIPSYLNGLNYNIADFLTKFILYPVKNISIDSSQVPKIKYCNPMDNFKFIQGFSENLAKYYQKIDNFPKCEIPLPLQGIGREEVELIVFGTGSADPSHTRNVTGMLLNMFKNGSILVDSGSGTYHQMYRKFGDRLEEQLVNIRCVWVSHKHPDHHNGLIPVLKNRQQCLHSRGISAPPIIIIGPRNFEGYLREYSLASTFQLEYQFYHHSNLYEEDHPLRNFFFDAFGIVKAQTVKVIHGGDAAAFILTHKNGWKVVFSGDTRPSQKLVQIGKDCSLLVHEATLCDLDRVLALQKAHSTTSECRYIAKQMRAYRVILTHFSQRQLSYPVTDFVEEKGQVQSHTGDEGRPLEDDDHMRRFISDDEIKGIDFQSDLIGEDSVIIGFDLMSINFADLAVAPAIMDTLKCLYQEEKKRKH